ncbi:MAG: CHRD domain-containing protein [Phycisphaerales bacterium]|nr:CHRD domain-containing protein [Phycisphaerales bacterium]
MSVCARATVLLAVLLALCAPAQAERRLSVRLSGQRVVPPNNSPAVGQGTLTYDPDTNLLSWNISFQGLVGTFLGCHFHGAAGPGQNAPIRVTVGGTVSPLVGSTTITEAHESELLAGLWYLDIHTISFPGGEIRGQIVDATLVTYQGRLKESGNAANGTADLRFKLFDAESGGSAVGDSMLAEGVVVQDGLFAVELPFDVSHYAGAPRWLEVEVAYPAGGAYTTLTPRQPLSWAPRALYADESGPHTHDAVDVTTGVLADARLPATAARTNAANTFTGNNTFGGGSATFNNVPALNGGTSGSTAPFTVDSSFVVSDLNADMLDGLHAADLAQLAAENTFTGTTNTFVNVVASGFIGTTSGAAEFRGGNVVALRLYGNSISPNIIGGYSGNGAAAGVTGAVICGGGEFESGSFPNFVWSELSFIGGGRSNIAGSFEPGEGEFAVVVGGNINHAEGSYSFVGGGEVNQALGDYSTVPGGAHNTAGGKHSVAMGRSAKVRTPAQVGGGDTDGDEGTFVWSDTTPNDFMSTGPDQFLIRASGGVGIGTAAPESQLHVFTGSAGDVSADPEASLVVENAGNCFVNILGTSGADAGILMGTAGPFGAAAAGLIYNDTAATLDFRTLDTTRMSLDTTGRVGIGTTSPSHALHVARADSPTLRLQDTGTTPVSYHIGVAQSDNTLRIAESGIGDRIILTPTSGLVGVARGPTANRLEVNGEASKTTAGNWLANSDARIKTDVRTIAGALATLDRLRLVSFRYTDAYRAAQPEIRDRRYVNVIAQEFAEVFPEWVQRSGEKLPGAMNPAADAGCPEDEILQVDTYPITIYTAAAVQELHGQLRERDKRIADLEARLARLEQALSIGAAAASRAP